MEENTYNGWTNYETWAVALWIDNDCGTYTYWREVAAGARDMAVTEPLVKDRIWSVQEAARFRLADRLKSEITDEAPLDEASVYVDLLGAALAEVDWHEIADYLLADLAEAPV